MTAEGIFYLALLALQFGMQPLLYKEFMAKVQISRVPVPRHHTDCPPH